MIPYGRQEITNADIDAVTAVLRSDFLTQGPQVSAFEEALADYCGANQGVAVNSATSALHLACIALGLTAGGLLWTSPNSFVASANCARFCSADVDFVDIDADTGNMDPEQLEHKLIEAQRRGRIPNIVIPVHFGGQSCDMRRIAALAKRFGFRVIEDASHAVGGRYDDEPVGSCRYSDVTVFSFHPVKIITSGEGGMALTNDASLAAHMRQLRGHGITRDPERMTRPPEGPWDYQQAELGFNYRMTDIQAALGLSQLDRLDAYVGRRQALADRYDELLAPLPVQPLARQAGTYSAFHLYVVRLPPRWKTERRVIFESMREMGVGVNVHYIPIHLQPYYQSLGFRAGDFVAAESYYRDVITLPMFATMDECDQDHVVTALMASMG